MGKEKEIVYEKFLELQQQTHQKNQRKIRVGLRVNILLPLVFLITCFITDRSKLVFLLLWIISLFGISFYLLYVEYMDFKLQEQLKELGIMEKEAEAQALIGEEVLKGLDGLKKDIRSMGDKLKK